MGTWLYIASGIGAFIVFVLMFVLMTLADDLDSVNNEARDGIEKT